MLAELIPRLALIERTELPYRPRPSNSGPNQCIRKLVYQARGAQPESPGGRFLLVLDDSSWHEELTLDWLAKSCLQIHSRQLRLDCASLIYQGHPLTIRGSIDAICTDLLSIDRMLEHKAIEHFTFQRYTDGEYPLDYLTQCCLYLPGLQKLQPHIQEAILLIKNKNTSAYLEYRMRYDALADRLTIIEICDSTNEHRYPNQDFIGLHQQALQRFKLVDAHATAGTLPDRPFSDSNDFHCRYCGHKERCWDDCTPQPLAQRGHLTPELTALAQEYVELDTELKPKTKRLDEIKRVLKQALKLDHTLEAEGAGYRVQIHQSSQTREDTGLLPAEIRVLLTKTVPIETIRVSRTQHSFSEPSNPTLLIQPEHVA